MRWEETRPRLSDIKNDPATRDIPLLVASSVEDERKAYALGADGYLRKPVERDTLLTELARCDAPRILVIDDDPASRYAIKKILSVAQYGVVEAVDGGSGLALAHTAHPQLVILDLSLPDIKGEEVLLRLAHDAQTRALPVLIATSRDLGPAERQALQQHASAVLSKRNLTSDMLPAVASALMRGAGVTQS
jgi:CheY-like chemotaxis protein